MKIVFASHAEDDLDGIFAWIAKDNPIDARRMIERIEDRIYQLDHPALSQLGHLGAVAGTLELVVASYIVVYKITKKPERVVILSVVHGARNRV